MTTARDSEIGFELARDLKMDLLDRDPQPDAAAVLHCCCWLLADVITQAVEQDRVPVDEAIAMVTARLITAVARLTLANEEAATDAAAVKH